MSWASRITNVFRSRRLAAELEEEFRFHVEQRMEALMADGMERQQAEAQARRQFGNQVLLRETSREVRAAAWLYSLLQDVRFGCRVLWKDRTAMGAAGVSLALALGACSTAFSLLDALILRPLPVAHPESLVRAAYPDLRMNAPAGVRQERDGFSYPLFRLFRQAAPPGADLFGAVPGTGLRPVAFGSGREDIEAARVASLSGNGFDVLGIRPALGRLFNAADDTTGSSPVAVLSDAFWKRRFARNPAILGSFVTLAGRQFRIAGIAQKGFDGLEPGYLTDLWITLTVSADAETLASPDATWVNVWGRSRPGDRLDASLQVVFTYFRRAHTQGNIRPGATPEQIAGFVGAPLLLRSAATGADSLFRRQFRHPLWIFGLFSVLLLVIAATNIAGLFLARGAGREREMALRLAIGAGRGRLVRQLGIESALLAGAAGAAAVALGAVAARYLASHLGPSTFPSYLSVQPGWRLLLFMALACTVATILFGVIPALRASTVSPDAALRSSARQTGRTGLLRPLLSVQAAFSFAVLFLSGQLLISFTKLMRVDPGFATDNVVLFSLQAAGVRPEMQSMLQARLIDHLTHTPGVRAASLSQQAPIGGAFAFIASPFIRFPGRAPEALRPRHVPVSPGFFAAMQIRLLRGRELSRRDVETVKPRASIVNQSFAGYFFPGRNALGQRFEQTGDGEPIPCEIVGVVANSLFNDLREPVLPTVYSPLQSLHNAALEVRTQSDPAPLAGMLRREIESVDPQLTVRSSILQSTRIADTLIGERLLAWIAGFFGIAAALLVAVGLHGAVGYFVARRTKDIGVRMALGAARTSVVRLVLRDVTVFLSAGIAAGLAAGIALSRYAASLLFEVKPADFGSLAAPLALLLAACAVAALRPVLRATRIDPVIALRCE